MKRTFDFMTSLLFLLILLPFFLIISILIKITSKGPVFFIQNRVGKNGVVFPLYKFRSMTSDKKAEESFDFSKDHQRVTKIGKFIRRTKIDELPQLVNVLLGHMSIVGPRPTIQSQVEQYTKRQKRRLEVRPGLTGWAQVNGNIFLSWEERIEYDIYYIENQTFWFDVKIILRTIAVVLFGEKIFVKSDTNLSFNRKEDVSK